MRRFIVTLVTVFSMCYLVACGGEKTNDANTGSNNSEPEITAAPTLEPTVEPTTEPTAAPTPDPVETLTTLRDEAIAEQDAIEEVMQAQIDLVYPLLEVVKGLPNFVETPVYTNIPLAIAELESSFLDENINSVMLSYNFLIYCINLLIVDYPEITETEEFKNLLDAPTFDTIMYELKVTIYNDTLANTVITEFEELPYCLNDISSIEY